MPLPSCMPELPLQSDCISLDGIRKLQIQTSSNVVQALRQPWTEAKFTNLPCLDTSHIVFKQR